MSAKKSKNALRFEGQELTVEDANRVFFVSLAHTRASLSNLRVWAVLCLFILGLDTAIVLNALVFWEKAQEYTGLFYTQVVLLGLCVVVFFVSLFRKLLHRYQTFFSSLLAVMAALMVYSICMMVVGLASFDGLRGQGLSPVLFGVAGACGAVLVLGATGLHVLLLRRRLRMGYSKQQTVANFAAVSRASWSKSFWIGFPVVLIVPNVITHGQFFVNTLGVAGLILFAVVFPSLPVECTYLAYLKSRDRGYWQSGFGSRSKRRRRMTDWRRWNVRKLWRTFVVLFASGVVVMLLAQLAVRPAIEADRQKYTSTATGTVVQSEIGDGRGPRCHVVYSFSAGGEFQGRARPSDFCDEGYEVGDVVRVYYDPANPSASTIFNPRTNGGATFVLVVGILSTVAGLGGGLLLVVRKRYVSRRSRGARQ